MSESGLVRPRRHVLSENHLMSTAATRTEVSLAIAADAPRIARLVEHYWRFEKIEGFAADEIQKLLTTLISHPQLGAVWLATMGRSAVGYAIVSCMFSLEHRGMMAEIDEFFVLPEARSHGVGARLLAASQNHLRAHGFVRVPLQINRDNQLAHSFYRRRGFEARAAYQLLDKPLAAPPPKWWHRVEFCASLR